MGLSVAQAVADLGLDVGIKWPNDVVVSRKKICGILTEMTMKQDKIGCAVIGVGINETQRTVFIRDLSCTGIKRLDSGSVVRFWLLDEKMERS